MEDNGNKKAPEELDKKVEQLGGKDNADFGGSGRRGAGRRGRGQVCHYNQ